ncbi:MAG: branched-chain amino acid ABC transporter substrate-binding protein [Desulforhopalus sp.]
MLIAQFMIPLVLFLAVILSSCSELRSSKECTDPLGCIVIGSGEPVKIGVLQALSGKVAPLGQAQTRGLELVLDKRGNSLLDHPVALQIEDTGCTPEGGANAALKIIADPQTIAIFGTTCSGAAATASKAISSAGLTMISGNNSAPFLTSIAGLAAPDWQPGYFRTAANEEHAGQAAAGYVFKQLGLQRAATIHDNDIYTRGLTESFSKAFTALGGEIVLDTAINKGETEMEPVLTAVIHSQAQVLFFPLFQDEGINILRQARALSALESTLLISDGALIQKSFLEEAGELAKGMYFVGPSSPKGPAVEQLAAAYEEKYKEQPTVSYYLSGYDAADLLVHAIDRVAIRDEDGTLHIGRKALREQLYNTSHFKGVTGTLNCNRFGDCTRPAFDVLHLENPSLGLEGLLANVVFSYTSN